MPSLIRLSARSTVTVRRGSPRASTPTAVASVGASAAPSTHAGPHARPSACAVHGDRGGGGEDQRRAGEHHDPEVVADLPQRGGQALPVEQRGQEQQQHHLRRQLGLPQARHEADQHPHQHEQDGRRDRVTARQSAAGDQGDPEHDDHLESQHGLILTGLVPDDHLPRECVPRERRGFYVRRWKLTLPPGSRRVSYFGSWTRRWWWGQSRRPVSTLVWPPWDHGWSWWAWHMPGGVSQPFGGAAAVADAHRDAHGFGVQAAFAAGVEDLALAAEDDRDDAGGAGQSAGLGCGDAAAGVEGADPGFVEVGEELFEGHRDHDGGRAAAGPGELVGGVGLDQLGEGDPVADRGGQVGVDAGGRGAVGAGRRWIGSVR